MSAVDNGRNNNPIRQRTLLDIIKDDKSNKDKKSWKTFRDKIRLKRAGSAWTSSVRIPASDVNVQSSRSRSLRLASEDGGDPHAATSKMQMMRRDSARFRNNQDDSTDASSDAPPSRTFKPQMTRHASTRLTSTKADDDDYDDDSDEDDDDSHEADDEPRPPPPVRALAEDRSLSAREAVAAQEAAEAAAAAEADDEPVKMSLMDLLGETGYAMGEDDDDYDEEEEEEEDVVVSSRGGMEYTCCVCMVKHKGSGSIPCGHTFCRLCSRELTVQRGNCPLCNGYILEILDIF